MSPAPLRRASLIVVAAGLGLRVSTPPATPATEPVRFTDITAASGVTFTHAASADAKFIVEAMSGGVALFDFDRDGRLDIYLVNAPTVATGADPRSARSELWRNAGDGTFVDVTDRAGVGYPGWGMGVATGDYDNDGWEDLYVTCFGPDHLYRNKGDGTFVDVTAQAGVSDPRWSTGAAFADYDNDGWLDLFVANYVDVRLDKLPEFGRGPSCQFKGIAVQCGPRGLPGAGDTLFHNNRDGTFTDVSSKAGVSDEARRFGLGVAWCDFNDDGRVDLFVANDVGPNYLYRNNGDGAFTEIGLQAGVAMSEDGREQASMGVAIGDYNHRGRWSLVVTNFSDEYNALYRQEQGFLFSDASYRSQTAPASLPFVGWGTHLFDYDNDGWLDLIVVNGHVYPQLEAAAAGVTWRQRSLLYRNRRDGTFAEIAAEAGPALMQARVSRGSASGDLDNDGDLDIVINNLDGRPTLLRNDGGNARAFLSIALAGRTANRSALGARVRVTAGDLVQIDERRSGGSYLSQNDTRLHFGFERRSSIDRLEVTWPGGATETIGNVPINTFISVREGDGAWRPASPPE
jgi:hypothetical protein